MAACGPAKTVAEDRAGKTMRELLVAISLVGHRSHDDAAKAAILPSDSKPSNLLQKATFLRMIPANEAASSERKMVDH